MLWPEEVVLTILQLKDIHIIVKNNILEEICFIQLLIFFYSLLVVDYTFY